MSISTRCIRILAILLFATSIAADDPPQKSASPKSKPATKSTAKPGTKPATKPKNGKGAINSTVPTEKECAAYGKALARAINQNDREAIQRLMDWKETLQRATQVPNVPQKFRDEFTADTFALLQTQGDALVKVAEAVQAGARFKYHRCAREGNDRVAQFRELLPDGSVDFYTILLRKQPDRKVVGIDLKTLDSGDYLSTLMRPTYLAAAAAENQGLIARLSGADQEIVESMDQLATMTKLINEGTNGAEVLKIYDELPAKVQLMRSTQLLRVMAARTAGNDKTYVAVMEDFLAKYPNDPSVDSLSIDYHFLRGNIDGSIAAIDRLSDSVGGDAYLGVLKTKALIKKGDLAAARKTINAARKAEPSLIDTYWKSIDVALAEKEFATVAEMLDRIAKQFNMEFNDLSTVRKFDEFAASPEGKAWQTAYNKAQSASTAEADATDK